MNLAIDRNSINKALFGKYAVPTSSFIPSDMEPKLENYWEYNPEKAKKLLKEAGYADGFTLKASTPGPYYGNLGEPLLQAAAKNLEEVGIKVEITPANTEAEYGEALSETKGYNLCTIGAGVLSTPSLYGSWLKGGAGANWFGEDPVITKLYKKMWEQFTNEGWTIPMVAYAYINYVSEGIEGVQLTIKRPWPVPSEWYAS
jgi:peptide/nickel transport system substrate-binding protein